MRTPDTQNRESERGNPLDKRKFLRHVFGTYNALRLGMAVIAFAFPILLYVVGRLNGLQLQGSMSAYYWASIEEGYPPVRIWFVGVLFAIGSFLVLYKGYDGAEDWLLNGAAGFAILVALFPMSWNCGSELGYCPSRNPHSWFAIAFFVCIWCVALLLPRKTLTLLNHRPTRKRLYNFLYIVTNSVLLLSPVVAIIVHLLTRRSLQLTWLLEVLGIYAFGAFWLIKTLELRESGAEVEVLEAAEAGQARVQRDLSKKIVEASSREGNAQE